MHEEGNSAGAHFKKKPDERGVARCTIPPRRQALSKARTLDTFQPISLRRRHAHHKGNGVMPEATIRPLQAEPQSRLMAISRRFKVPISAARISVHQEECEHRQQEQASRPPSFLLYRGLAHGGPRLARTVRIRDGRTGPASAPAARNAMTNRTRTARGSVIGLAVRIDLADQQAIHEAPVMLPIPP